MIDNQVVSWHVYGELCYGRDRWSKGQMRIFRDFFCQETWRKFGYQERTHTQNE